MATKTAKRSTPDEVQHVAEHSDVKAFKTKLDELTRQLADNDQEAAAIRRELSAEEQRLGSIDRAARAMLRGSDEQQITEQAEARLAGLDAQKPIVERAIRLCQTELAKARAAASREICQALRGEHVELCQAIIDAAAMLKSKIEAERAFSDDKLRLLGADFNSPPLLGCTLPNWGAFLGNLPHWGDWLKQTGYPELQRLDSLQVKPEFDGRFASPNY